MAHRWSGIRESDRRPALRGEETPRHLISRDQAQHTMLALRGAKNNERRREWIPAPASATSLYTLEDIEPEGAKDLKYMPHLLGKCFLFLAIAL